MVDKLLCDGVVLASGLREILMEPGDTVPGTAYSPRDRSWWLLQDGLLFGTVQHRTVNVISDMLADYSKNEATAGNVCWCPSGALSVCALTSAAPPARCLLSLARRRRDSQHRSARLDRSKQGSDGAGFGVAWLM